MPYGDVQLVVADAIALILWAHRNGCHESGEPLLLYHMPDCQSLHRHQSLLHSNEFKYWVKCIRIIHHQQHCFPYWCSSHARSPSSPKLMLNEHNLNEKSTFSYLNLRDGLLTIIFHLGCGSVRSNADSSLVKVIIRPHIKTNALAVKSTMDMMDSNA